MLEVGIEDGDGGPFGLAQPGEHRRLLAEVPAQHEVAETRVQLVDGAHLVDRRVAAAVIDEKHLEGVDEPFELPCQHVVEAVEALFLVEARDDDRELDGCHAGPRPPPLCNRSPVVSVRPDEPCPILVQPTRPAAIGRSTARGQVLGCVSPLGCVVMESARSADEARRADVDAQAELLRLRNSIDNLDAALVHVLAERFKCTQQVGILKATQAMPPADPEREAVQIERLRRLAAEARLDPEFAEKFLSFVIAEVLRHHEAIAGT